MATSIMNITYPQIKKARKAITKHSMKKINNFTMTDDSGSIQVLAADKPLVHLGIEPHQDLEYNNKRFKEYILEADATYLLIGSAETINDKVVITHSTPHYLLGLSPQDYVVRWNKARPFVVTRLSSLLLLFCYLFHSSNTNGISRRHPNTLF